MLLEITQELLWHFRALLKFLLAHVWTFKRTLALQRLTSCSQPALLWHIRNSSATPSHSVPSFCVLGVFRLTVCVAARAGHRSSVEETLREAAILHGAGHKLPQGVTERV